MVYFTCIEPTEHYLREHAHEVPWTKVVELVFRTKDPRKKGDKFEIVKDGYYILFGIKDDTLFVINAKRT
ncbi:hypothetical protein KY359_03975 [Candidatus Woesearchaeota archaeon]|nr:hypothetical protein [Candidatus Woesearchaeota archaeon]